MSNPPHPNLSSSLPRFCESCEHLVDAHGTVCRLCACRVHGLPQTAEAAPIRQTNEASHFSQGKEGVDQIDPQVLLQWGAVYEFGANKYGRNNYLNGSGLPWHELYASALRHLLKFWSGQDLDDESRLPHLAHVLWNIGALMQYQRLGIGKDDRITAHLEPKSKQKEDPREVRKHRISVLKEYLQTCFEAGDWHGVSDAANDLREVEAAGEVNGV